jgi:signal peptide peptidase SppA
MHHELARLLSGRWWIAPSYIETLQARVRQVEGLSAVDIQAAKEAYSGAQPPAPTIVGDVAVIEVCGAITYRSSWISRYLGWATIEDLQIQLRAALADTSVKTILFRWDSPGGVVDMVKEFADEIYAARGAKAMVSVSDLMICSAAYWLASQTDTIYATDSSQIGSIGVYTMHVDLSAALEKSGVKITFIQYGANKTSGNPYEPLGDDTRAIIQAEVDEIGGWFDAAVARGRSVTKKVVGDSYGQGLVFSGPKAIELGLADKRGTFGQVLGKLTRGRGTAAGRFATAGITAGADEEDDEGVDPDEAGECPDGYDLDDDGMCYLTADAKKARAAQRSAAVAEADSDAAGAAIARAERQ